jgi:hypothetical protein
MIWGVTTATAIATIKVNHKVVAAAAATTTMAIAMATMAIATAMATAVAASAAAEISQRTQLLSKKFAIFQLPPADPRPPESRLPLHGLAPCHLMQSY